MLPYSKYLGDECVSKTGLKFYTHSRLSEPFALFWSPDFQSLVAHAVPDATRSTSQKLPGQKVQIDMCGQNVTKSLSLSLSLKEKFVPESPKRKDRGYRHTSLKESVRLIDFVSTFFFSYQIVLVAWASFLRLHQVLRRVLLAKTGAYTQPTRSASAKLGRMEGSKKIHNHHGRFSISCPAISFVLVHGLLFLQGVKAACARPPGKTAQSPLDTVLAMPGTSVKRSSVFSANAQDSALRRKSITSGWKPAKMPQTRWVSAAWEDSETY